MDRAKCKIKAKRDNVAGVILPIFETFVDGGDSKQAVVDGLIGWRVGHREGEGGGIDGSSGGRQSVDLLCSVQGYAVVWIQRVLSCFTLLSV